MLPHGDVSLGHLWREAIVCTPVRGNANLISVPSIQTKKKRIVKWREHHVQLRTVRRQLGNNNSDMIVWTFRNVEAEEIAWRAPISLSSKDKFTCNTWKAAQRRSFMKCKMCMYKDDRNTDHRRWLKQSLLTRGDHILKK